MRNRSSLIAPLVLAACTVTPVKFLDEEAGTITVARSGPGTVASIPAGIDCGATCSSPFREGEQVTLTATPATGAVFAGWSGACSGSGSCSVDVPRGAVIDIGATFESTTLEIALAGDSQGMITSSPPGIACGSVCRAAFAPGTQVTLTAVPVGSPSSFAGWSISTCPDVRPCRVTIAAGGTSLTATFTRRGSRVFTTSGTFLVPPGVTTVSVLAVGGGGGGANGHQGGGGSGRVAFATLAVTPGTTIPITVGGPGEGAEPCSGCNEILGNTAGGTSAFGAALTALGGATPTVINGPGGAGGSGGGGSCNGGPVGGAGGTAGGAGGGCTYVGGAGQGSFAAALAALTVRALTAGAGGAGGVSTHGAGGGGGGVLVDGAGPSGGDGAAMFSAKGGVGYGAGGGGGGYDASGPVRVAGGDGAAGLVYVEW
jgi:hypothetical protein